MELTFQVAMRTHGLLELGGGANLPRFAQQGEGGCASLVETVSPHPLLALGFLAYALPAANPK